MTAVFSHTWAILIVINLLLVCVSPPLSSSSPLLLLASFLLVGALVSALCLERFFCLEEAACVCVTNNGSLYETTMIA